MPNIIELLHISHERKASDLHITVGQPPVLRIHGELTRMDMPMLMPQDTEEMAHQLIREDNWDRFKKDGELDFSYGIPGVGRFRVNAFHQRNAIAIALRVIPQDIPNLGTLGLPPVIPGLTDRRSGLILVTGPTGSGKSTTLAAMIDKINQERAENILTIEDPIEYLHKHKLSIINQRELGQDTRSYSSGLRAALREDPDIILIGEMRDLETTATAISAAETGHLVLATLHTPGAAQTIDRILDIFPPHQQAQIRVQLAMVLQAVISQYLITRADGQGRVVACEVLLATPAVRSLIREAKTHQINSVIQTGVGMGMQTMEQALKSLLERRLITEQQFHLYSPETKLLKSLISGAQGNSFMGV